MLTTRQGTQGVKFRDKYFDVKLRTVLEQCAIEHYLRFWWSPSRGYPNNYYTTVMNDASNKFHTDYDPLPDHPFVVVDCENHGATTDLILDTTTGVYEWQRLDFYDHKGRLSYSGYVKSVVGHEVTLTDCLHDEKNRNYHRMPNEPKRGMVGIEPNMNQLCLVDRYLKGEYNDYIKGVMKDFFVSDFKLPKAHVA
ncbi:MAG: hypothetical protein LUD47_05215 [Clostridia bacterium]|nr:hypothetical protein [Clostridia bacterium]